MSELKSKKQLEEKLAQIKKQEEETRAKQLAQKLDLPYLDLSLAPIDAEDMATIPEEQAKQAKVLVIDKSGPKIIIAAADPQNKKAQKIIEHLQAKGFQCQIFVVSLSGLKKRWPAYQSSASLSKKAPLRGVFNIPKEELSQLEKSLATIQELEKTIRHLSTTKLLSAIIAGALKMKASDIHLEPEKNKTRLRYRVDGILQKAADMPNKDYLFILSRIKTLSDMLLNVRDISQDGRFSIHIKSSSRIKQEIDVRVSLLPSNHGETIVMRLLGIGQVKPSLRDLGIKKELLPLVEKQIGQPNGMILSTGPTGSGKTTTLYSFLNYVNQPGNKIITVENPIEYQLEGITQTQISQRRGHTFAQSLRAIVRQDPDILMVGEIRDQESADIAIQFSLTGHIVFSTLHTNEAAGAIPRLTGMGARPDSLASALTLIIAQRLVRKLCPECKKKHQPSPKGLEAIEKVISCIPSSAGIKIPPSRQFYQPQGCSSCHGLGYQGRVGVFEFLAVSHKIGQLIIDKASASQIQGTARREGMILMIQDALLKASEGITSLEEIEREVGSYQIAAEKITPL